MPTRILLAAGLFLAAACSDHGSRGGGPHDYVRCMAVDAEDARTGRVGAASFRSEDRVLTFTGLPSPLRVAAFRSAGSAATGLDEAMLGVGEQSPSLVFVLGGFGADEAATKAQLASLAKLRVPTIVIPGGDDSAEVLGDAFEDGVPPNVFDGRRFRRVETGSADFLLLSGAPEGRYAATAAHCGNDEDDREELEARRSVTTMLVSWAAPSGGGAFAVGRGFDGVDAGDRKVAALAHRLGDVGGIFAFPATRAGVPAPADGSRVIGSNEPTPGLRLSVPRIVGPADERDDFGLVPNGAVVIEIGPNGPAFVGLSASEGG